MAGAIYLGARRNGRGTPPQDDSTHGAGRRTVGLRWEHSFVSTCAGLCPRTLHRVPLSTPTRGTHGSRGLSEEQAQESEVGRLTTHANQRLIDERPCHLPSGRHHDAGVRRATCMQVHVCLQIRTHVQANKPGGIHISTHDANVEEIYGTTARIAAAPCSSVLQTALFFLSPNGSRRRRLRSSRERRVTPRLGSTLSRAPRSFLCSSSR